MSIDETAVTEKLAGMTVTLVTDPPRQIAATEQARRERAFLRRQRRRAKDVTPAGRPIDGKVAARRHAAHVADLIATFCPHEPKCETFGSVSCPEGFEAANRAINAEFATRNRLALEIENRRPRGNPIGRIKVVTEESPEGRRILSERIARHRDRQGFDAELARLLGVG